jgi:hypothetical protein
MTKERIIKYSKDYLTHTHETLRKAFSNAPGEEKVFIESVLKGLEKDVEQLELLEEMIHVWKITKNKKMEMIEEE